VRCTRISARYYILLHGNHEEKERAREKEREREREKQCKSLRNLFDPIVIRKGNRKELLVISIDLTKSTSSGYENPIMKHSLVIGRNSYAQMI